jgi:hypothetical protein
MYIFEIIVTCLFIIPAALFLFIILSSILLRITGINLQEQVTAFFLKAYGWQGEGTILYADKYARWGYGILFTIVYGSILISQLGIILRTINLLNMLIFIFSCVIAYCALSNFVGSYYSGAVSNTNGITISPLGLAQGVHIKSEEISQLRIRSCGSMSFIFCPQWNRERIVLLSAKQLTNIITTATEVS